ncbi:MAG: hypothetical protein K2M76_03650, partial [Muribaculaceae bacterium]|nr:hypothetical protein [Muribaculaceae bacterium]
MKPNTLRNIKYNKVLICAILAMLCCNLGCREQGPGYTEILLYNESDEVIYAYGSSYLDEKLTPEVALMPTESMGEVSELKLMRPHSGRIILYYHFGNDNNQIL